MKGLWRLGLAAVVVSWGIWALAAGGDANPPTPLNIQRLLQDRQYTDAVAAIEKALQTGDPKSRTPPEFLAYLKGRALHLAGQYDDAITAYEKVEADFPNSPWAARSKF